MKTLLRGGTVVNADGCRCLDVLLEGEKILQVGRRLSGADRVADVAGCLLFPGFVDGRTHFGPADRGPAPADDFASGTRSALRGGTTTVVDFACPDHGETLAEALARRQREAEGRSYCDYGFHMALPRWDETVRAQLPEIFAAGVSSFRFSLDGGEVLDDGALYLALKCLKRLGGASAFHCENGALIAAMARERLAAGKTGAASFPMAHPEYAEAEAVGRLLRIAQAADAAVILSPITCRESLGEVERARKRGQSVYAATCPQYLLLDDSVYYEGEGAGRYVCGTGASRSPSGRPCGGTASRPWPAATGLSPSGRRNRTPRTSPPSPPGSPERRTGVSSSTPSASAPAAWRRRTFAGSSRRLPPGSAASTPGRALSSPAATRTLWSTIPGQAT